MKLTILIAVSMFSSPVLASDLDLCDFNKSNGACSRVVSYDEATGDYSIPATG